MPQAIWRQNLISIVVILLVLANFSWGNSRTLPAIGELKVYLDNPENLEPLLKALENKNTLVRKQAAKALSVIGKPAIKPLIPVIIRGKTTAKWAAAQAMNRMGEKAVVPLINLLENENSLVRGIAAETLGEIGHCQGIRPTQKNAE